MVSFCYIFVIVSCFYMLLYGVSMLYICYCKLFLYVIIQASAIGLIRTYECMCNCVARNIHI